MFLRIQSGTKKNCHHTRYTSYFEKQLKLSLYSVNQRALCETILHYGIKEKYKNFTIFTHDIQSILYDAKNKNY